MPEVTSDSVMGPRIVRLRIVTLMPLPSILTAEAPPLTAAAAAP